MNQNKPQNQNKQQNLPQLSGRRKDPNIPVDLWPLKDQLEYWDSRTDADRFNDRYTAYSIWYDAVKERSGLYHRTFIDFTHPLKTLMRDMYDRQVPPADALHELRKHGVY